MRPVIEFLSPQLLEQIVSEARTLLATLGVEINNPGVMTMLSEHGAEVSAKTNRAFIPESLIENLKLNLLHEY